MFKRKNRGFTIVELLVVIGIILILAAFITPAVQKGKSKARVAQCVNNIRQVGMAQLMWASDNNDTTTNVPANLLPMMAGPMPQCPEAAAAYVPYAVPTGSNPPVPIADEGGVGNHTYDATMQTTVDTQGVATFQ